MKITWVLLGMLIPISALALPVAFYLIRRSARKQEPLNNGTALEFSLARSMQFLIGSVIIALSGFSALVFVAGLIQGEGWYGVFIPLIVLLAILMAKPKTVVLDHDGIRQRGWFIGDRKIAWNEIAWMKRGWRTGTTYVKSKRGGRPVSFSPLLVGRTRFEGEVRKHTLTADFGVVTDTAFVATQMVAGESNAVLMASSMHAQDPDPNPPAPIRREAVGG